MLQIGDKILIIWNTEGLPQDQANGHYPNEAEIITIDRIDDEFYYDDNTFVEIEKNQHFYKIQTPYHKGEFYLREKDVLQWWFSDLSGRVEL